MFLLSAAQRTLELYILVKVDLPGSMDRHIILRFPRAQYCATTASPGRMRGSVLAGKGLGRAAHGERDSRAKARVAAAVDDEAALPPRYTFLVLFQQLFVGINLNCCHGWRLGDGGTGRIANSVARWVTRQMT